MSYRIENKDIVISGFADGIADDPYKGISDMRNVNITSVPGEASVALKTTISSPPALTGVLTATTGGAPSSQTFTADGTFTVPANVHTISVELWAAAGSNNSNPGNPQGGSGGGAYTQKTIAVTPGAMHTVTVGQAAVGADGGDSWFSTALTALAKGGKKNAAEVGGAGGLASAGIGDTKFSGGTGGNSPGGSGGGGGGANASGNGGNGGNGAAGGGGGGGGGAGANNGANAVTTAGGAGGNGSSGTGGTSGGGAGSGTGGGGGGDNTNNGGAAGTNGGGSGGPGNGGGPNPGGAKGGGVGGWAGTAREVGGRGEVKISYSPQSTLTYSSVVGGTLYNREAVIFAGGSLPTGIVAGTVYFIGDIDTLLSTFNLYTTPALTTLVAVNGNGSGTFASLTFASPKYFTSQTLNDDGVPTYRYFVQNSDGRVWYYYAAITNWVYLNNTQLDTAYGNGLGVYHGYLFAWRATYLDYLPLAGDPMANSWVYGWNPIDGTSGYAFISNVISNTPFSHEILIGTDDAMYSCDSSFVQSVIRKVDQTFDPTDPSTYTWSQQGLALPNYDSAQCLAELGNNLLVGGALNAIYPWDRVSPSFTYPILVSDTYVKKMVTVNTSTYMLVGRRGKIYITNGSQAEEWKKVPDHLSNTIEPYFAWGGIGADRENLYFGVQATTNGGVAINQYGGLWAINLKTKALRLLNKLSYGTYAGLATALLVRTQNSETNPPPGYNLFIGWSDGAGAGGIDGYSGNPYIAGESIVTSDMIPIGTFLKPFTPSQIEWKTSVPLVAGENVAIYFRGNLTASFTLIPSDETTLVGAISEVLKANFEKLQWIELQGVLTSSNTTPTYTRLTEIRIRDYPSQNG